MAFVPGVVIRRACQTYVMLLYCYARSLRNLGMLGPLVSVPDAIIRKLRQVPMSFYFSAETAIIVITLCSQHRPIFLRCCLPAELNTHTYRVIPAGVFK